MIKKSFKTLTLILTFFIMFFINKSNVNAQRCEYRIWYSGVYPALEKFAYFDSNSLSFDTNTKIVRDQNGHVQTASSSRIVKLLSSRGIYSVSFDLGSNSLGIETWHNYDEDYISYNETQITRQDATIVDSDSVIQAKECPSYIRIIDTGEHDNNRIKYKLQSVDISSYDDYIRYYFYDDYENHPKTANRNVKKGDRGDGDILNKQNDYQVDPYYFNMTTTYQGGVEQHNTTVLPTVESNINNLVMGLYNNEKVNQEAINKYLSSVLPAWMNIINHENGRMFRVCGENWKSLVDRTNYRISTNEADLIQRFVYKSHDEEYDQKNNVNNACIDVRAEWTMMWISLYEFYKTISQDTAMFTAAKIYDADNNQSQGLTLIEDTVNIIFMGTAHSTRVEDSRDDDTSKLNELYTKLNNLKKQRSEAQSELCLGICCTYTGIDETCKTSNTNYNAHGLYKACTEAYDKASTVDIESACKAGESSNSCIYAKSLATGSFNTASFEKAIKENDKLKNSNYNSYDAIKNAQQTCINNIDERIKEVEEEIEKYKQELQTRFESEIRSIAVPNFAKELFGGGYKVNCEDVTFLHTIYIAFLIFAPVLVIVLGIIDFSKEVIATGDKMGTFKKLFPKRLLALVLLVIIPILISLILKIGNLEDNLMYCIVNGTNSSKVEETKKDTEKSDSSDTSSSTSKKTDNKGNYASLIENRCYAICYGCIESHYNATACDNCKKDDKFKKCDACLKDAKEACKNSNSGQTECINARLKSCYGDSDYDKLNELYDKYQAEFLKTKK